MPNTIQLKNLMHSHYFPNKQRKKKTISIPKIIIFCLIILGFTHVVFFNNLANELLQPTKREIQTYHLKWLNNPGEQGIIIQKETIANIPYLLVTPHNAKIGERGSQLREQLVEKGLSPEQLSQTNGIIVMLHGRKGRKEDLLPIAERFAALGFTAALPDLPAHGDSTMKKIHFATNETEKNYANIVLADAYLKLNVSKETLPAYLWGMSLGGVFANASAVSKPENWQALAIVSSFDNLEQTIKNSLTHYKVPNTIVNGYASFLQKFINFKKGFSIDKVTPQQWVKNSTIPVIVVHGDKDNVITIDQGNKLYQSYASTDKKFYTVPEAGHDNVLVTEASVHAEIASWFLSH